MLQVGTSLLNDRRHSAPQILSSLAPQAMETRRHSMADIMDGQQQYLHSSNLQNEHHLHGHDHGISSDNGALGLSLSQLNHGCVESNTRSSTPSDFLYPHVQSHSVQHSPGFPGYSPAGHVSVIPNISSGSVSSRPSTAASSLSLSHSLRRTSASSRPSTAGSYVGTGVGIGVGASATGHQYLHRPASSGSVSGTGEYPPVGISPFSFQLGRNPGDVSLDAANAMDGYTSACISRPSTANSAPSAAPSPYMRHGAMPLDPSRGIGVDRWHASPLLGQTPLAQPQPQAVDGSGLGGYFQQMMSSPPQHSRTHSPAW
ncbi:uncharacterized protein FOMMEDRAFT_137989 [Fomitiporia mediterranea MF3/22]|uniref:uncharacterized protein n=1 Tax=Fomitiporia mediterranea (strain MF3/22) TaxID=694068 RepID=UPI0004409221|nr:uncharacterized protein FOMMEDRAFT_137989 [Fomitiporia mediterranea MF3/22]EJD07828.1 hypothetical protein FOMMEDRAFT_137989 [Fomitiporia mediterranea MF3/22]